MKFFCLFVWLFFSPVDSGVKEVGLFRENGTKGVKNCYLQSLLRKPKGHVTPGDYGRDGLLKRLRHLVPSVDLIGRTFSSVLSVFYEPYNLRSWKEGLMCFGIRLSE